MEPKPGLIESLFDMSFNEFITTRLIKFIFVLGILAAVVGTIMLIVSGFMQSAGVGVLTLIVSPFAFFLYVLIVRVWLELLIVIFRIAEHLREIEISVRKAPSA